VRFQFSWARRHGGVEIEGDYPLDLESLEKGSGCANHLPLIEVYQTHEAASRALEIRESNST
jgi:hypothetical protein